MTTRGTPVGENVCGESRRSVRSVLAFALAAKVVGLLTGTLGSECLLCCSSIPVRFRKGLPGSGSKGGIVVSAGPTPRRPVP